MRVLAVPFARLMRRSSAALAIVAAFVLVSVQTEAQAQAYPDRTITLVVPFPAGGGADATGRIIADAMAKHLGQSIIVENVSGASGSIGHGRVKNAAPDGYTIGLGTMGTLAASVAINPKLKFDLLQDFEHLGLVNTTPNIVFVRKGLPANTLSEFVDYARAKGRDLKIGTFRDRDHLTHHLRPPVPAHWSTADLRHVSRLWTNDQRHPFRFD